MTTQPGITVDLRQFNQAILEYAAFTKKDLAYSLNRALKDVAYAAMRFVKIASISDIMVPLFQHPPKLIAWMLRKRAERHGFSGFQQRNETIFETRTIKRGKRAGQTKRVKVGSRLNKGYGKYYTERFAMEYHDRLVGIRKRSVGFLRSFWLRIAKQLQSSGIPGGGQTMGARDVKDIIPSVKLATPQNLVVEAVSAYTFKRQANQDTSRVEAMLMAALQPAIDFKIADIRKFVEEGMNKNAKRISVSY